MKPQAITVFVTWGIIASCLLSCEKDIVDYGYGEYYEEIVTAIDDRSFLLDNGKTIVDTGGKNSTDFRSGDRVFVNYTLLPEITEGYDYTVRINGAGRIPQGELMEVNGEKIESAANEPVFFESVWLGSHYLNMRFYIRYRTETHAIGLMTDSTQLKNDTIHIYFKHDSQNDPDGPLKYLLVSFDMEKTLGKPENRKILKINIHSTNYGNKIYELKY